MKVSAVFPVVTASGGFRFGGSFFGLEGLEGKEATDKGVFESLLRGGRTVSPHGLILSFMLLLRRRSVSSFPVPQDNVDPHPGTGRDASAGGYSVCLCKCGLLSPSLTKLLTETEPDH